MTWVNMKKLDGLIESRIMLLINRDHSRGMNLQGVKDQFVTRWHQKALVEELPGWLSLSEQKRGHRIDKIISRLIRGGRARIAKEPGEDPRLIPLNVLDKIVFALEVDDKRELDEAGQ